MKKLLALGLAMMMVMAFSGVALAQDPPGDCEVTFTVLDMNNDAVQNVNVHINGDDHPTGADSNTVIVTLQQQHHYDATVDASPAPLHGSTRFFTGDETAMSITIYMLYDAVDEGDTTRVLFEVTDAIGVTLHAHQERVSIRTEQTSFPAVQFDAKVHYGEGEISGEVTAFTKDGDGDWTLVSGADPLQMQQIKFELSTDDEATFGEADLVTGVLLPQSFSAGDQWQQDFWLKGITHEDTPANTMGNIYFKITLIP